jgi:hypothetical protein
VQMDAALRDVMLYLLMLLVDGNLGEGIIPTCKSGNTTVYLPTGGPIHQTLLSVEP